MARGISLVNVSFQDLRKLLGDNFNGKIPVSVVWLRNTAQGTEEFTMVKADSLGEDAVQVVGESLTNNQPPPKRATFTVDE